MREIYTTDTKQHMCDTCPQQYPNCDPVVLDFGDGYGNDNIIRCSEYTGPYTEKMEVGKIAPKR